MAKQIFKPIYERSLHEQSQLLRPLIETIQHENLNRGLYNSYRDAQCVTKDLLIRQYSDRKILVQVDSKTGCTQIIKSVI